MSIISIISISPDSIIAIIHGIGYGVISYFVLEFVTIPRLKRNAKTVFKIVWA